MIPLSQAYLCPGNDSELLSNGVEVPAIGTHITTNSRVCECGNTNLVSLERILNREPYMVIETAIVMRIGAS